MDSLSAMLAASAAEHLSTIAGNVMSPAAFNNSTTTVPSVQQPSILLGSPLAALAAANLKRDYIAFTTAASQQNVIADSPLSVGSSGSTSEASPLSSSLSPADIELVSKFMVASPGALTSLPAPDNQVLRVMRNYVSAKQQTSPLSSMITVASSAAASPHFLSSVCSREQNETPELRTSEAPKRIRRRRTRSPQSMIKRPSIREDEDHPTALEENVSPASSVAISTPAEVMRMDSEANDSADGNEELSAEETRQRQKTCRVCGDQATGYNFNVVSCESCKAYFRRNANRQKEFKCPYNDNCEITPVSRRFCQKCRLKKCFQVGMRREWILNEEQLKRRKNSRLNCGKSITSPRSPMERKPRAYQNRTQKTIKTESMDLSPKGLESEVQHRRHEASNPLNSSPFNMYTSIDSQLNDNSLLSNTPTLTHLHSSIEPTVLSISSQIPAVQPTSTVQQSSIVSASEIERFTRGNSTPIVAVPPPFSSHPTIAEEVMPLLHVMNPTQSVAHSPQYEQPPSLRPAADSYVQPFSSPFIESASQFTSNEPEVNPEPSFLSQIPETSGYNSEGIMGNAQVKSPSSGEITPIFSFFSLSPTTFHSLGRQMQNVYENWPPMLLCDSTPTIEKAPTDFPTVSKQPSKLESADAIFKDPDIKVKEASTYQLNSSELCALDVVRQAYSVMDEPLDDNSKYAPGVECLTKEVKNPSDILNIMDVTMRRFVKMTKRLSAFVRLSQEGKLALLKAAMIQMLTIRGVTRFDTKRFCWSTPISGMASVSCHVFDQLNDTRNRSKNRFLEFCYKIPQELKEHPVTINLIGLIILFQNTNVLVDERDRTLARESHSLYSTLLRRFLESTITPYERACDVIALIPDLLAELGIISNVAETLFVGRVQPAEVEQLPQEFFVTKLDSKDDKKSD
ncbi:hypothetical protein M3Y94_00792600 [Aphelenchoides besseyi]|nr:hypothetical protein M3Y94_00792600 [Aphelenchoides besseyi]KAI6232463.1 hypothetical protein M3Y95_00488700 [Aphelenchoides besseyi]